MFECLKGRTPGIIDWQDYKKYALGIVLTEYEGETCIIFEVRAHTLKRQPGEVCLPGGRVEQGEDFCAAAVRETAEELEITPKQLKVIAPMDIYLSPSGQCIAPYLMKLTDYHGTYNAAEVAEVFFVPLEFFLKTPPVYYKNQIFTKPENGFPLERIPGGSRYPWHSGESTVYFYPEFCGHQIWGLTAKVMKAASGLMRNALSEGGDYGT